MKHNFMDKHRDLKFALKAYALVIIVLGLFAMGLAKAVDQGCAWHEEVTAQMEQMEQMEAQK